MFGADYAAGLSDSPVTIHGTIGGQAGRLNRHGGQLAADQDRPESVDAVETYLFPEPEIGDPAHTTRKQSEHEGPIKSFKPPKKESWFKRHLAPDRPPKVKLVSVKMRESEYAAFFANDEKGEYREGVVEPPGGRAEWLRKRVEEQASW